MFYGVRGHALWMSEAYDGYSDGGIGTANGNVSMITSDRLCIKRCFIPRIRSVSGEYVLALQRTYTLRP